MQPQPALAVAQEFCISAEDLMALAAKCQAINFAFCDAIDIRREPNGTLNVTFAHAADTGEHMRFGPLNVRERCRDSSQPYTELLPADELE